MGITLKNGCNIEMIEVCDNIFRVPTGNPFKNSLSFPLVFPDIKTLFKYVC